MTGLNSIFETPSAKQLVTTLLSLNSPEEMQTFLRDVMTEKEIIEISARLQAAKMLKEGKKYTEIIETTKLSSRTVARISDWLQHGTGGYGRVLEDTSNHHDHTSPATR